MSRGEEGRIHEWWVPKVGPERFRLLVGLSFYPYSFMNASYVLIGSLLAPGVHFGRMAALAVVYLLAVGISAHAMDAMAPNKPWGEHLTRGQLTGLAAGALAPALALGLYLALSYAPLLIPVGLVEISASRPYKELKREGDASAVVSRLESVLKGIVSAVLATAAFLLAFTILG